MESEDNNLVFKACDAFEEVIGKLTEETRSDDWTWSYIESKSDEEHVADFREQLRMTREHFNTEGSVPMSAVFIRDAIVCLTGTSPTADARAHYLAMCSPKNIMTLVTLLRFAYSQESDAL